MPSVAERLHWAWSCGVVAICKPARNRGTGHSRARGICNDAATASVSLGNFVIRLRPAGYFYRNVNQDGNVIGNVCHLFNDGTSSKLIL